MKKFKVFLDDMREAPSGWILLKHPTEVIELLKQNLVTELSLDHDLGTNETGYDVLLWIEEAVYSIGFKPPLMVVHTSNPSARIKMESAIQSIDRFFKFFKE